MNPNAETWSLPEHYHEVESAVPGVIVYAPIPKEAEKDEVKRYACPNCGATVAYDVSAGGVACEYCGYVAPIHAIHVGKTARENEFTLDTVTRSELGWGEKRQELHCDSCGAALSIPYGALTHTCAYCGSNEVNVTVSLDEDPRPRFLIPFKVTPEQSKKRVREWLGKGWLHPDDLATGTIINRLSGIYLPFWTFDTKVDTHWRAQVGHEKTERYYDVNDGRWKTRTRIEWRWEEGQVPLTIDDFLVSGITPARISQRLLQQLYPYQMRDLVTYEPDFLAGWQAQAYEVTLTDAWKTGKTEIREKARNACYQDIASPHVRNFSMSADFQDESWRYILLPIYLAAYRSGEDTFQVLVNGQTGEVAGQKPVAWWKVWLVIAVLLSPGLLLGLIGLPLLLFAGVGAVAIGLGILLFMLGGFLSFLLFRYARDMEAK
jgi:DNA-directed RNA polymerase subunit RPC12/RpoP